MPSNTDSVYNDPAYDISSVPSWKSPPLHGAYSPNARLSSRAKVGIGAAGVVLAASGMFAWSDYSSAQADAAVKRAQIAVDASRVDLERQKQDAELAKSAGQETEVQKARREAVQACVDKAGGGFNAVSDCGKAFPMAESLGMSNTAQQVGGGGDSSGPTSGAGLIVLGVVGAGCTVGWVKRRLARA